MTKSPFVTPEFLDRIADEEYPHSNLERELARELIEWRRKYAIQQERILAIIESHRDATREVVDCAARLQGAAQGISDEVDAEYHIICNRSH